LGITESAHLIFTPAPDGGLKFRHNTSQTVQLGPMLTVSGQKYTMDYGAKLYLTLQNGRCEMELHYKQADSRTVALGAGMAGKARK
jgi:hypothetical protein